MPDDSGNPKVVGPTAEDDELRAMNAVVAALKPLGDEERSRVLEYVIGRFGPVRLQAPFNTIPEQGGGPTLAAGPSSQSGTAQDIRSLKESKNPSSAIEMAALVAYYVSEIAPIGERRNSIGKPDIEKYFKSAGFKLPADAYFTLTNAKNAGYLDGIGGGKYKLNPVGYNLVAHRMGAGKAKKTR